MKKWAILVATVLLITMLEAQSPVSASGVVGHSEDVTSSAYATESFSFDINRMAPKSFDNDPATAWNSGRTYGQIGQKFPQPLAITKYTLRVMKGFPNHMPKDWTFEGYNAATDNWVVLDTRSNVTGWDKTPFRSYTFANTSEFTDYRLNITDENGAGFTAIGEIEMMTDNPPYTDDLTTGGVATASHTETDSRQTTHNPAYSFDDTVYTVHYWNSGGGYPQAWLQYEFPMPQRIGRYTLMWQQIAGHTHYMAKSWTFEGYDESTGNWVVLDTRSNQTGWVVDQWRAYTFENVQYFKKYRINISESNNANCVGIGEMQMMGIVGEPLQLDIDTTNTAPYGGQTFDTYVVSRNATDLASEAVTVKYDPSLYELVATEPQPGFQVAAQNTAQPGQVSYQVTNNGAVFSTTSETRLLKIKFRAKDKAGSGRIETTAGTAVTVGGTQKIAALGGESIKVSVKQGDVNLDGYVTVGDLAMAGKTHAGTPSGLYSRADVDQNGVVDDADLQFITDRLEAIPFTDGGSGYTFDLTQGGDVTASSSHYLYQYYQPRYAFDGDTTSGFYWNAGTKIASGWLDYEFRFPQRIGKYSLLWQKHTGYEAYMPKDWTFEGYNAQTGQWVVLDSQTNISGWATGQKKEFAFANENYYKKYRVNISASNHASYVGVGEMEMFGIVEKTIDPTMPGGVIDMGLSRDSVPLEPHEGDTVTMNLRVAIADDIFAEESVVEFDPNQFEYLGTTAASGTQIYKEEVLAPGKIRFVTAQRGAANGINDEQGNNVVAQLQFLLKTGGAATGYGSIYVSKGTAATSTGVDIQPVLYQGGFTVYP